MIQVGDRVRLRTLQAWGSTGTVTEVSTVRGKRHWMVRLDVPRFGKESVRVTLKMLDALADPGPGFEPGQRVTIEARLMRGRSGTLVRRSHLLWKPAWLVDVDGLGRTRVTERSLISGESP